MSVKRDYNRYLRYIHYEGEKTTAELMDSSLKMDEPSSFPVGQRLVIVVDVVEADRTWMLIESLTSEGKLIAGCEVREIRMVEKKPPGVYIH